MAPSLPSERSRQTLEDAARSVLDQVVSADGVGVTVLLPGGPAYAGATPFTTLVDDVQYALMEGPCVSAADSGAVVRLDLRVSDDDRWPRFRTAVEPMSLREVVSVPLTSGGRVIGSLNVYSKSEPGLTDLSDAMASRLAERVEPAASNVRTLSIAEANARLLRRAAGDRRDVDRAVTWLMQHYAANDSEARILLGQISREHDSSEADTARRILAEHVGPHPA